MSFQSWQDDDEEQEDGNDYYESKYEGRDGLILLIDTTEEMFIKNEDDKTPFDICVQCARNVMSNKIISSDKDLVGVVFFGTDKTQNSANFKYITVYQKLAQPGAESILDLETLAKGGKKKFQSTYGHNNNFMLSDSLWTCSSMFSNSLLKIGSKRILLFTTNDDPHANNVQAQQQARQKAKDLYEIGIELDLMHIQSGGRTFDISKFYQDIISLPEDEEYEKMPDASSKLEELMKRVRHKDHKKRKFAHLSFSLGGDVNFGVGVYTLTRTAFKPSPVNLSKATNEELRIMRKTYLGGTGEILFPSDIHKYQTYGGKRIQLDQEELKEIRKFYDSGIVLMGFKPQSCLKPYYHIKPAQFIYPDEEYIRGSTTVFAALLQKCIEREVIPICRYTLRRNVPPRFVALLPQEEVVDESNVQLTPPGFHVIFLPFADDLRQLDLERGFKAKKSQIDTAKSLVKKLQFNFSSENFENPVLQTHWSNVEALALDKDKPEEVIDYTLPNYAAIDKRAANELEAFKAALFPKDYEAMPTSKRKARSQELKVKRTKTDAEDKYGNVDFKKEAELGRLEKLTVDALKTYCHTLDIITTGKRKAELVNDIYLHLGIQL